jgi:putative hydrolase of the HAD superfamily
MDDSPSDGDQTVNARCTGLLVDFGGVLTSSVVDSFRRFCDDEDIPLRAVIAAIQDAYSQDGTDSPIIALETGAAPIEEIEQQLAATLLGGSGRAVAPKGLVRRLMAGTTDDEQMWRAVQTTRDSGIRTGLLSNSWGPGGYPIDRLKRAFDVVVISGDVGLRKPDPQIFRLAVSRLGLAATECVFVDDFAVNVAAAEREGFVGVLHKHTPSTIMRLEELLGVGIFGKDGRGRTI